MFGYLAAMPTEFLQDDLVLGVELIFLGNVIIGLAHRALERKTEPLSLFSHNGGDYTRKQGLYTRMLNHNLKLDEYVI